MLLCQYTHGMALHLIPIVPEHIWKYFSLTSLSYAVSMFSLNEVMFTIYHL